MASYNKVLLMGNLTRDPELRYTPKGTAICQIGLAINRNYTTETGEKKEEVTFVDVEAWARTAEVIAQYLKKGRPIFIEGRLRYDTWDDKQTGQKRSRIKVVCENFQFIDSGGQRAEGEAPSAPSAPRPRPAAPQPAAGAPPSEGPEEAPPEGDDVPF